MGSCSTIDLLDLLAVVVESMISTKEWARPAWVSLVRTIDNDVEVMSAFVAVCDNDLAKFDLRFLVIAGGLR